MRFGSRLAYTGAALAAIMTLSACQEESTGAAAFTPDPAVIAGDMTKLVFHDAPIAAPQTDVGQPDGGTVSLAAYRGRVVVLNFWATWCVPCRKEMPQLAQLQREMGGGDLAVLPVSTGPSDVAKIDDFLSEIGADDLDYALDPRSALAREMGVLGLPVTVLIDRDGFEVARLTGEADWSSDSAKAILAKLMAR